MGRKAEAPTTTREISLLEVHRACEALLVAPKEQSFSVSGPCFPLKNQSSARRTVDLPAPFGPMNVVTESNGIITSFNVRKFFIRADWIFISGSISLCLSPKSESSLRLRLWADATTPSKREYPRVARKSGTSGSGNSGHRYFDPTDCPQSESDMRRSQFVLQSQKATPPER
jgi:hypothetical protein